MDWKIIEREITIDELEVVKKGFEHHSLQHGIRPIEQKRLTTVSENNGVFAGCATGLIDHNWFYITDLWLDETFRGQGIGRQLMERLEKLIKNEKIDRVYTWTAGYEALEFYKRMGYSVFIEFENYYPTGESRYGLHKNL